ncbi:MAG: cupin-like domain-containing protein [Thermoanaerobaculia bacterium]|nr:cupin-like domain-containing protein [Thermoanaerobaculia bacterium]
MGLPRRIFEAEPGSFRGQFNRLPFSFSHNLGNHPLFDLPRLTRLCRTLDRIPGRTSFQSANSRVTQGWSVPLPTEVSSAAQAIERIHESGSWVLLKSIQEDPEYAELLRQCLAELQELTGEDLRREITWSDAYVFIASPRAMTPYHIDHESNFLIQIHGEKDVNLFDPSDRSILTEEEIERYYIGEMSAAVYREEVQKKAHVFRLKPGVGVHHPVRAPHWVQNGEDYSVSLSVLFFLRDFDLQARVYQVNHYLRKLHLSPTPPGQSALRDAMKILPLGNLGHKPRTKSEVIRFGYKKFIAPVIIGRRVMNRLRGRSVAPARNLSPGPS